MDMPQAPPYRESGRQIILLTHFPARSIFMIPFPAEAFFNELGSPAAE